MKLFLSVLAGMMALMWLMPEDAEARNRGYGKRRAPVYYRSAAPLPYYGRPPSVGPNGLCQRDTGTPTGQLNFRNRCDTEEFWNRTMQGRRR